jgi:hypothetical protein
MQPTATTASTGQPVPSQHIVDNNSMAVTGMLIGAIIALAGAIAVLWRRSERRAERQLKVAEETRERDAKAAAEALAREVARTNELARELAATRREFTLVLEKQREDFGKMLHDTVTRQAEADRTRDATMADLVQRLSVVLDAAQRRMVRVKG